MLSKTKSSSSSLDGAASDWTIFLVTGLYYYLADVTGLSISLGVLNY